MQQLVELQHQVKEKGVDVVLPVPTIKTEPTEVNQPSYAKPINTRAPFTEYRYSTYQENTVAKSNTNTFCWCF